MKRHKQNNTCQGGQGRKENNCFFPCRFLNWKRLRRFNHVAPVFYTYGMYYETVPICRDDDLGNLFHSAVAMQFIAMAFVRTLSYDGFSDLTNHKHPNFEGAWVACYQAHLCSVNDTRLPISNETPNDLVFGSSSTGPVSIESRVVSTTERPLLVKDGDAPKYRAKVWKSHVIPIDPLPCDSEYLKLGTDDISHAILATYNSRLEE